MMRLAMPFVLCHALIAVSTAAAAAQSGLPAGTRIDTVARGLQIPWGVAFAPDGRIYASERPGRIRIIENGRLRSEPWAVLPVAAGGAGLLGLAVSPDYRESRAVYVTGSFPAGRDSAVENRLYVLRDENGNAGAPQLLLGNLPSARAHAGSAVIFGPDDKLWVTLGDAFQPAQAQDRNVFAGKILRMEPDGSPALDNPWPGSRVYALGLRNPQGLAWDPASGSLFATEHGPSAWPWEDGRTHDDELNVIVAGGNYGWPHVTAFDSHEGSHAAIAVWTPAIAPSGLAFYTGAHAAWRNSLLLGALRGRHLRRIQLERDARGRWSVAAEEEIHLNAEPTRIRGVLIGPDGHLYVTTSDRVGPDGRPDDHLYRIVLPGSQRSGGA
jgi:aldose sugar dehydrogenase